MFTALERKAPFLMYCGPALSYTVVIFIVSSLPGSEMPHLPFWNADKVVHFLEFGLFGIFLYRAFRLYRPLKRPYLLTLVVGIPYAALDEVHQYFVPGRNCSQMSALAARRVSRGSTTISLAPRFTAFFTSFSVGEAKDLPTPNNEATRTSRPTTITYGFISPIPSRALG